MADPTAYFYQSLQSSPFTGTDPVKGSLEVERSLSDLATAREARAGQRLNQQLTGLNISEFQANAPLRAAKRDWELGGLQTLNTQFGAGLGAPAVGAPATGVALPGAAGLIAGVEGFRASPYEDMTMRGGQQVSAGFRIGYGSDTITRPDGTVVRVAPGMQVSEEDAQRDLTRRINTEFTPRATQAVGAETWATLPAQAQEALVSVTYNYGSLPRSVVAAAKTGDVERIAAAVEGLANDNSGVNRQRRLAEAAHVRSALTSGQAAAAPAQPQAQPRAIPNIPGMLGEAPMRVSAAGVPMTGVPEGDLQPTTGAQAQAGLSQSGTAQTPGGATVQVPGTPAQTGGYPGLDYSNRGLGILQAIGGGIGSLFGSRFAGITGEGAPAAPAAPAVNLSAPSQLTLGGSAPIPATTFGSTMAGGTGTAGALSPTPFAGQATQGLLPTAAQQAQRAQQQAAQPAGTIPAGLELIGPARQQLQQITQQRALLQQRMALARTLSPSEAAKELIAVQTENIALGRREMELRSDQAIGQMTMGQPQALDSIFQQTYGVRLQPVIANNRVTGYNLLRGNTVVAENVTPEALSRQARLGLNQTFREQEAAAALPFKKAQVDAWLETEKQLARATADTAIAQIKQQFTELAVAKQSETSFIVYDKNNPRATFVVSETNVGVDGKPLPKGEKRWASSPIAITPTVVR